MLVDFVRRANETVEIFATGSTAGCGDDGERLGLLGGGSGLSSGGSGVPQLLGQAT